MFGKSKNNRLLSWKDIEPSLQSGQELENKIYNSFRNIYRHQYFQATSIALALLVIVIILLLTAISIGLLVQSKASFSEINGILTSFELWKSILIPVVPPTVICCFDEVYLQEKRRELKCNSIELVSVVDQLKEYSHADIFDIVDEQKIRLTSGIARLDIGVLTPMPWAVNLIRLFRP
jgi:hypothetical protein